MKHSLTLTALVLSLRLAGAVFAHDLASGDPHPHYDWSVNPPEAVRAPEWFFAQLDTPPAKPAPRPAGDAVKRPPQAAVFAAFAPRVSVRWDERFLFVESNGLPAHNMMVGITAWQQQVPLPQNYTGANAWQFPLVPVPAKVPLSIKGRFLRGAIALAANGIPIFNPQNNRAEVSAEIGELDQWGGHCGRADDYHYHAAPLHLQSVVGKGQPIAFALDGYPIYGLTEPDGSLPVGLDTFNGHSTPALGYHYHASTKYPYVNGGFHGEVVEREAQVDPQPRAQPVRRDQPPLRGAKITGFETTGTSYKLSYEVGGDKRAILYSANADGTFPFEYQNGREGTTRETYTQRPRGGGGPRPDGERPPRGGGDADRPPRPEGGPGGQPPRDGGGSAGRGGPQGDRRPTEEGAQETASQFGLDAMKKPSATFLLTSPAVANGGALPVEFTGDGPGSTLPLAWTGVPAGVKSYALIMHHLDPEGKTKWYWTLYNIPAAATHLDKNTKGIGTPGTGFKGQVGYEPPHSKGPGAKTYVLTLYALSAAPQISVPASQVSADVLSAAIKDRVLASADLSVVYSREGAATDDRPPRDPDRPPTDGQRPPRREDGNGQPPPPQN